MGKITLWIKINIFFFILGFTSQLYSFNSSSNNFSKDYIEGICYVFTEVPKFIEFGNSTLKNNIHTKNAFALDISFNKTNATCDNKSDGSISVSTTGGVSPYSYTWTGSGNFSATGATINNLATGSYTVQVTDANNEVKTETVTLSFSDSEIPIITSNGNKDENTNSGQCGALVTVSATASDNCAVSNPTGIRSDGKALTEIFPVGTTSIKWNVTDANGNPATEVTQTVVVTDNEQPVITANGNFNENTDLNQCGANITVTATAIDNCTVGNPTGIRSDGKALTELFPIGTTTIKWNVSDVNNNSAQEVVQTVIVTDNQNPLITTNGNQDVSADAGQCGAVVNISATASDNCTVGNPTGVRSDGKALNALFPIGTTTIKWNVKDVNNNSAQEVVQTVKVTDTEKPIITTNGDKNKQNDLGLCGASIAVSATASDNCSVSNPTGIRSDGKTLTERFPVGTTIIKWNVTDINNNTSQEVSQTIIVTDNEAPVPTELDDIIWGCEYTVPTPVATDNCEGAITVTANRSTTFTSSGDVIWTFRDIAGNTSTATQKITIIPLNLNPADISVMDVLCNGLATGEVEALATGGIVPLTYDWGSLGLGSKKTNLPAGTYQVKVSDANGCEVGPVSVTITEPDTFIEIIDASSTSGCFEGNNGTATVEAQGGKGTFSYLWENGQTTQTATGLAPGSYRVTVSDENGCSKERTVVISSPSPLQITGFLKTETTSFGSATGTATVQVSGGSGGYTFLWSNGQTGQTASALLAGEYMVTVTDSNGCPTSMDVIVVDSIEANMIPTSICENSGNIIRTSYFEVDETTLRGGSGSYEVEWIFDGDASINNASGFGPHKVTYSSIGDKQITMIVKDKEITGLEFRQTIIQYVGGCFSDDCGSNDLGIDDYYIGYSNGTAITSDNCSDTDSKFIYINIPTSPQRYSLSVELIYSIENIETGDIENFKEVGCFYEKLALPDQAKTFQIPYNCGDIVKVEGIFFTFQVNSSRECGATQGNGNNPKCFSTNNEATVSSPLFAVAFPNELLCNGAENGRISVRVSGGTSPYSYKLLKANTSEIVKTSANQVFEGLPAGVYDVVVSDNNDPIRTFKIEDIEINQPTNPLNLEEPEITNVNCFGGENGSATVNALGGTPNTSEQKYIYVWSNGQTGPTATNLTAGDYTVTVTDSNGCSIEEIITLDQPNELLANAGPDQVLGCGFNSTNLAAIFETDETTEEEQSGLWTIVNGPSGGSLNDPNDPSTLFTGTQGTYTLRWSVTCGKTDDVKISFQNCSTLDFDGENDHINMGDNYGLNSENFSLEAWIKPKSIDGVRTIISKRDYSDLSGGGYDLVLNNGIPTFRFGDKTFEASNAVNTNRWYHIAVTKNNSEIKIYVDGIEVLVAANSANPVIIAAPLIVGAIYDAATPNTTKNQFHGWIEELRIWKTALTIEQLRFMMNQRIRDDVNADNVKIVRGEIIPIDVPNELEWADLDGYYRLIVSEISGGITEDRANNRISGKLVNITTSQQNSAPLPYESAKNGSWRTKNTWLRPDVWDVPNATGINNTTIYWNIVKTKHTIYSNNTAISILGLISETGTLTMEGSTSNGTGKGLTVTHYLNLNGNIDLQGESQLVQTGIGYEGQTISSKLDEASKGYIERDQQGTARSYNYNYWSSPVVEQNTSNTSNIDRTYTVASVLLDGTNPQSPRIINFGDGVTFADGAAANPRKISNRWIYKFKGKADEYSDYELIGSTGELNVGEGYTMKGTDGTAPNTQKQNYVFRGKPNNGDITLEVFENQNYMIGNPYPSALDSKKFILDNLNKTDVNGATNDENVFNGALYFWDHFGGENDNHVLREYVGGYATYNLIDGVKAIATDDRINSNTDLTTNKKPGQFIPVGQGFFINTAIDSIRGEARGNGGNVIFRNSQREFKPENSSDSQFLRPEIIVKKEKEAAPDPKIRLDFSSPLGYHRQILVGTSEFATNGFDLGYDAPLNDYSEEDFFWLINNYEYVIQGVSNFNPDQVLPIGVYISKAGEAKIEINKLENIPDNTKIYLKDLETKLYHDLRESEFKIELEPGAYYERFQIVFEKKDDDSEEAEEEENEEEAEEGLDPDEEEGSIDPEDGLDPDTNLDLLYVSANRELAIINPDNIAIQKVIIYNVLGQKIQEYEDLETKKIMTLGVKKFPMAVYLVKMYSEKGEVSKNIVLMR